MSPPQTLLLHCPQCKINRKLKIEFYGQHKRENQNVVNNTSLESKWMRWRKTGSCCTIIWQRRVSSKELPHHLTQFPHQGRLLCLLGLDSSHALPSFIDPHLDTVHPTNIHVQPTIHGINLPSHDCSMIPDISNIVQRKWWRISVLAIDYPRQLVVLEPVGVPDLKGFGLVLPAVYVAHFLALLCVLSERQM
ncbi:uncharacterized protein LOC111397443 [Olea europaea var. sylvestris]|uniref:uncharacterized protein LOC111397443 n=1 Tax=Olea europaea var. sylvestris TaxID=158386 RepID=UPI000C1D060D|nr:uncharacterized protein LOC111397443 [Olea europaea var. sylvestris]